MSHMYVYLIATDSAGVDELLNEEDYSSRSILRSPSDQSVPFELSIGSAVFIEETRTGLLNQIDELLQDCPSLLEGDWVKDDPFAIVVQDADVVSSISQAISNVPALSASPQEAFGSEEGYLREALELVRWIYAKAADGNLQIVNVSII